MSTRAQGVALACAGALGAWGLRDVHAILIFLCTLLVIAGVALALRQD